jgi:uncharacterized protein
VTAADEAPPPRIETLDILRGVAVMGILAMNIVGFAMPVQAYFNPLAYGGAEGADLAAWAANFILIDGKMRGLFSFLFGASLLLVLERAEARGESPAEVHFRRMLWLLLFGLVHYYLVWLGDILAHYAIVGMIAFLYHRMPVEKVVRWGVIFLSAQLLLMGAGAFGFFAAERAALAPGASAEAVKAWREMSLDFRTLSPRELADSLALYRGGYDDVIRYQLTSGILGPAVQLMRSGFETLGLMLLGMASLRSGFLSGAWEPAQYRKVALAFLGVTILAYALLAWTVYRSGFSAAMILACSIGLGTLLRPAMVIGYAALIILLARPGGWLTRRIAAAGRAAFTNYLGTSLIVTAIFYGFGQFGRLGRAELWLVVLPIWALMLLWSKPWLDRYLYGPFEWLWRSLARGEPQPMRRAAT